MPNPFSASIRDHFWTEDGMERVKRKASESDDE
jgi:hypothetical protein